ncbi:MAG: Nre family DNA repair protein [Candidatus Helarchaeota archaeon]
MVRPPTRPGLCVACKGARLLCGKESCPILMKQQSIMPLKKIKLLDATELVGESPPSFFVGHYSYPNVLVGPMLPPNELELGTKLKIVDEPDTWFGNRIQDLVDLRTSLFRTAFRTNVNEFHSRLLDVSRELVMAGKPVGTEVKFEKAPKIRILYDSHSPPMGPVGTVKKLELQSNPSVPLVVEKVVADTDLKATAAMDLLYQESFSVTKMTRILSAGLVGREKNRKLVPTRWAITAVDDTISKQLISRVKEYSLMDSCQVFHSKYLDNNFVVILIPREWAFENLEAWYQKSTFNPTNQTVFMQDHEFYGGRTKYASSVTGAYYAARLAVTEYLTKIKKQAAVLVLREVSSGYIVPLGVWVIRETVRDAMKKPSKQFSTLQEALKNASRLLKIPIKQWTKKSRLIDHFTKQKTLLDYFKLKDSRAR